MIEILTYPLLTQLVAGVVLGPFVLAFHAVKR